ncbi:hypothetical protein GXB85_04740 [Cellulomonas sp. APG4]|uniref:hypothetical protein n=1 Tax=Cellulomonas sp. APG4 TaxID=1538656 RepID=UPI001379ADC1|nr:hypothetical protein [Cellulomonas sp. APG4]NCT90261.1 hypothetical protein [Cellulomonas sp. APG4]
MPTDVRGHEVPDLDSVPDLYEIPQRLSLSVRDPIPVANATERAQVIADLAALPVPIVPSSSEPVYVHRADAGPGLALEYTEDGTDWHTVPATPSVVKREAVGVKTVSVSGSAGGTAAVTFPAGRFTSAPLVIPAKQTGALAQFIPYVTGVTTAGCTIGVYAGDGAPATGSVSVAWHAIQED